MNVEPKELKTFTSDRQLLSARFSPCGAVLASGAMDRVVMRWSVVEKKKADEVALPDEPPKKPAPKNAKNAKPESPVELVPLPPIGGFNGWVQSIAFHPTEKLLFASDSWGKLACTPYEGDAPKPLWENATAHDAAIRRIAISADGKLLATCGADQFVRVWNSADGKLIAKHEHTSDVFALTFTPDATQIVFGDTFAKLSVLDCKADKIVRQFEAAPLYMLSRMQDVAGLRVLTFLDGGKTLLAAGCNPEGGGFVQGVPVLMDFDFATGKPTREVRLGTTKEGFVHDAVWHPDGFLIAVTSGQPGSGKLVYLRPGEKEPSYTRTAGLANCHAVALHPDKRRFVVTSTNANSNGNGRRLTADGDYPGNTSPLHLFEIQA
jgi:WD40 repeat protein